MEEPNSIQIAVIGGAVMFLTLALVIVFLLLYFNRRALAHHQEMSQIQMARQKELLDASFQVQERERERIGRDIHDDIGPTLSTVKYALAGFRNVQGPAEVEHQINQLTDQLSGIIQQVRIVSRDLTPSSLQKFGLLIATEELLDRMTSSGVLQTELHCHGTEQELPERTELALFRIVQELCNNVIRHAEATKLQVVFDFGQKQLDLKVSDNGIGMDMDPDHLGIGMKNIEARASLIDAEWKWETKKGEGTIFTFKIPFESSETSPTA